MIVTENNFKLPPQGTHVSTLKSFADEGLKANKFEPGKMRHVVKLVWEIVLSDGTTELWDWQTASLDPLANLRKIVKALTGKAGGSVDLNSLVGRKCLLEIEHREINGETRAKIVAYYRLPEGKNIHGLDVGEADLPEGM